MTTDPILPGSDPEPSLPSTDTVEASPDASAAPELAAEPGPAAEDGFAALGLASGLLATLTELGYEEPTPIQREAIPPLLAGRDVLGEAPTGTGKTAAFSLPLLQRLLGGELPEGVRRGTVRGLVLVPTRELAMQVSEALHRYGTSLRARVLPIYGGQPIGQQLRVLERGVDIVVATPGRAVDHLTRGSLSLEHVAMVVLDEADEMLDMGFAEHLEVILGAVPETRQTALFSATISPAIAGIARRHLREPERVRVRAARSETGATISTIRQVAYVVRRSDKLAALCRVLDVEDPTSALVFGRTRGEVDELAERLSTRGHDAAALHGGMSQDQRDRVMGRFRDGSLDVLVATDVAARGLDIDHVSHVVNFDVPHDIDQYVHRIGRTGRAGREGVAITLLEPREHRLLRDIERMTGARPELAKVPTVADLREHRLELLRANLREALLQDGLDRFRAVVEPLSEEFDAVEIALAAVSLAAGAAGGDTADEPEIPTLPLFEKPAPRGRNVPGRPGAPFQGGPGEPPGGPRPPKVMDPQWTRSGPGQAGWARLWIGGGRRIGLRPGDLVGAITNEAGIPAAAIGAIAIQDGFSLVDVREDTADLVVGSLEGAAIRGRRLVVRRDLSGGPGGPGGPGGVPYQGPEPRPWSRGPRPGGYRPGGHAPHPGGFAGPGGPGGPGGPRPPRPAGPRQERGGPDGGPGAPRPGGYRPGPYQGGPRPDRGPGPWSHSGPKPPHKRRPSGPPPTEG
jgi:ATP-dependent RNA helicase DeaD